MYVLIAAPIYQIILAIILYFALKSRVKLMMRDKADQVCNLSATTIEEVVIYDIPAVALNHEVDTVPANMNVFIKEIRTMVDGRWYYIEFGSEVGYCKGNNLLL